MIPSISVMAGAYIVLRCLEMMCRPASSWGAGRSLMLVASVAVILLTFWQVGEIVMAGAGLAQQFGR